MPVYHVKDTFTDSDDTLLTAHTPDIGSAWVFVAGAGSNHKIVGNELVWGAGGTGWYKGGTADGDDDHTVRCDIKLNSSSSIPTIGGRSSGAGGTGDGYQIQVKNNGVITLMETGTNVGTYTIPSYSGTTFYNYELRIVASYKKVFIDGVERISYSADDLATGNTLCLLHVGNTTAVFDNFQFTDVVSHTDALLEAEYGFDVKVSVGKTIQAIFADYDFDIPSVPNAGQYREEINVLSPVTMSETFILAALVDDTNVLSPITTSIERESTIR